MPPSPAMFVNGQMLRPGDSAYDAARRGHNLSVEHQPSVIFCVAERNDVIDAVQYARTHALPVAIHATGHGPTIAANGGVLINTSLMQAIEIDPVSRTAKFEAGVRSADLVEAAAAHGLAPLNGSSPRVGTVSYHLGGGVGMMGRELGYAADHVRSLEIVTADGRLRRVTAQEDADLFWALRGGGKGRFGVVTAMEIDLHPVTRLYGGGMHFGADTVEEVLHTYATWANTAPERMGSSAFLAQMPDAAEVPAQIRGQYVLHLRFAYTGTKSEGERLVAGFRKLGPLTDSVKEMPYHDVGTIHAEPTQPAAVYSRNSVLRTLDRDAVDTLLHLAGPQSSAPYMIELRHLGGAFSRPSTIPNALGRRDGEFCLYTGGNALPGTARDLQTSLRRLHDALAPWGTGGMCLNFIAGPDVSSQDINSAFLQEDLNRLAALQRIIDPTRMFRGGD